MPTEMFVSLPTADLERAKTFFSGIGWTLNPQFTDDNSACFIIDERLYLMILTRDFFSTFTTKTIIDPATSAQTQISISRNSREEVDALVAKAIVAGGREQGPAQDYGFMYSHDFEDLDGNTFGALWMDPVAAEIGPEAFMAQQGTA